VWFGRHFDLGLEKFAPDMTRRAEIGIFKQRIRRLPGGLQRPRIGQEVFFLDTELEQIVGRKGAGVPARRHQCPDAQAPHLRIESEFHFRMCPTYCSGP